MPKKPGEGNSRVITVASKTPEAAASTASLHQKKAKQPTTIVRAADAAKEALLAADGKTDLDKKFNHLTDIKVSSRVALRTNICS